MTILTDEQIEIELEGMAGSLHTALRVVGRGDALAEKIGIKAMGRQAFTIGRDQGKAEAIEAARTLIEHGVTTARAVQALDSLTAIESWIIAGGEAAQRSFSCRMSHTYPDDIAAEPSACFKVFLWDGPRDFSFYGSSQAEALAKAATWCTDSRRDTQPSPVEVEQ